MSTLMSAVGVIVAAVVFAHSAPAAEPATHHGGHTVVSGGDFEQAMGVGMAKMMRDMHAPNYTGNPDVDFLAMMIPHHEGAVEMARLLLIHGNDPATRRLAEDIIASQQVEIEGMRRRLEQLRSGHATQQETFPALGGTRGVVRRP